MASSFRFYKPMHEVTPKVVAMAVSTVMAICRIFCQSCVFIVNSFRLMVSFLGTDCTDYTDFHVLVYTYRSDYLDDTENL